MVKRFMVVHLILVVVHVAVVVISRTFHLGQFRRLRIEAVYSRWGWVVVRQISCAGWLESLLLYFLDGNPLREVVEHRLVPRSLRDRDGTVSIKMVWLECVNVFI